MEGPDLDRRRLRRLHPARVRRIRPLSRLLLDTHALLWWLADDSRLPVSAREAWSDPKNEILVSAVAVWEFAIKRSAGKLTGRDDLLAAVPAEGFHWLAVSPEHAWHVSGLPLHHRDPFDRLLVAQAQVEGLRVVTHDPQIAAYGVRVTW